MAQPETKSFRDGSVATLYTLLWSVSKGNGDSEAAVFCRGANSLAYRNTKIAA